MLSVFSPAKINIGLRILGKRADGYHDIETIFYPINWRDELTVEESYNYIFENTGIKIPVRIGDNLCTRAFQLMKKNYPDIQNVKIHLHKNIPPGSGLGGGSGNAAAILKSLNELFELNLDTEKLKELADELGSDVSFFIDNKPVLASSRGNEFLETDLKINSPILLVYPGIVSDTKEAYQNAELGMRNAEVKNKKGLNQILKLPIKEWKKNIMNDFEKSIFKKYPLIEKIKKGLYDSGAVFASMTGSGSAVYGIFENEKDCKSAQKKFSSYITFVHQP